MKTTTILLIDDHALFRSGLSLVLGNHFQDCVVVEAQSVQAALVQQQHTPDLVVLDLFLGDSYGLDLLRPIKQQWPLASIVAISADSSTQTIQRALQLGCQAFISKTQTSDHLLSVIRKLIPAQQATDIAHTAVVGTDEVAPEAGRYRLTGRQIEVLRLLKEGLSNKAIGVRLNISENTVRAHVQSILGTLHVTSRTEAIITAHRLGLVEFS